MTKSSTPTILITGATGNIGQELTKILSGRNVRFRAMVRSSKSAQQVSALIEDYAHYRRGEASSVASGVIDATGTAPRSFDDFARDYRQAFD